VPLPAGGTADPAQIIAASRTEESGYASRLGCLKITHEAHADHHFGRRDGWGEPHIRVSALRAMLSVQHRRTRQRPSLAAQARTNLGGADLKDFLVGNSLSVAACSSSALLAPADR